MDRKARILAGILGLLAGLLAIYNAIAERVPGERFPVNDVAMGVFWLALALYMFSGAGKVGGSERGGGSDRGGSDKR